MAVRAIARMGHPVLREIAKKLSVDEILSDETQSLLLDMHDSMKAHGGIGIAAPQIGVSKQVAIIELPEHSERYGKMPESKKFIIFNPEITIIDETLQGFWEGCLSVPGLRGYVERARKVRIDYLDQHGRKQTIEPEVFLATVFQHELDHLFGTLYIDRIKDSKLLAFNEEFEQFHT